MVLAISFPLIVVSVRNTLEGYSESFGGDIFAILAIYSVLAAYPIQLIPLPDNLFGFAVYFTLFLIYYYILVSLVVFFYSKIRKYGKKSV